VLQKPVWQRGNERVIGRRFRAKRKIAGKVEHSPADLKGEGFSATCFREEEYREKGRLDRRWRFNEFEKVEKFWGKHGTAWNIGEEKYRNLGRELLGGGDTETRRSLGVRRKDLSGRNRSRKRKRHSTLPYCQESDKGHQGGGWHQKRVERDLFPIIM